MRVGTCVGWYYADYFSGKFGSFGWINLALSGIFGAFFIKYTDSWMIGFLGGILVGTIAGALNATMITILKMNPLIVTLGMSTVWEGVTKLLNNGTAIGIFNDDFKKIGQGRFLGIPIVIFIMAIVYILLIVFLKYTKFGREAYAVGGNAKSANTPELIFRRYGLEFLH